MVSSFEVLQYHLIFFLCCFSLITFFSCLIFLVVMVVVVVVSMHAAEIPEMLVIKLGQSFKQVLQYHLIFFLGCISLIPFYSFHLSCSIGGYACNNNGGDISESAWSVQHSKFVDRWSSSSLSHIYTTHYPLLPFLFLSSFIVLVNVHAVKILVRSLKERGECNAGFITTLCFCLAVNSFYHLVSTVLKGSSSALSSFLSLWLLLLSTLPNLDLYLHHLQPRRLCLLWKHSTSQYWRV